VIEETALFVYNDGGKTLAVEIKKSALRSTNWKENASRRPVAPSIRRDFPWVN